MPCVSQGHYAPIPRRGECLQQREGLAAARIRKADPARLVPVLQRAATLGKGPLDVFTDAQFAAGGPCVLFLDESALAAVDRQFDLHGLWMVRAPVVGEGDTPLSMRYMLIGDGRLVVGYPRKATVRVADYAIFTGRYDYRPYMALDIVSNAQQRMLAGLRSRIRSAPSSARSGPRFKRWNSRATRSSCAIVRGATSSSRCACDTRRSRLVSAPLAAAALRDRPRSPSIGRPQPACSARWFGRCVLTRRRPRPCPETVRR